jgi:hypothetical protein
MARVTYESKDDAGHKFWVAHSGCYVIRIDANRSYVTSLTRTTIAAMAENTTR